MTLQPVTPLRAAAVAAELPTYDAQDLIQTGTQAQIILGDQTYVLRITRAGKLILTK